MGSRSRETHAAARTHSGACNGQTGQLATKTKRSAALGAQHPAALHGWIG